MGAEAAGILRQGRRGCQAFWLRARLRLLPRFTGFNVLSIGVHLRFIGAGFLQRQDPGGYVPGQVRFQLPGDRDALPGPDAQAVQRLDFSVVQSSFPEPSGPGDVQVAGRLAGPGSGGAARPRPLRAWPREGSRPARRNTRPSWCWVGRRRVTLNAQSTFPSAPLRTGLATFAASGSLVSFDSQSWYSGCLHTLLQRTPGMDVHVAGSAHDQRLTTPCRHDLHPDRRLSPSFLSQVFQGPYVVHLNLDR